MTTDYELTEHEVDRLAALNALSVLDTPRESRYDRVIRIAKKLFGVHMAAVTLVDRDRQWFKASLGLAIKEGPREHAFCNRTIERGGPFVVNDATLDEMFRDNPLVTGPPHIRFYAGQPLHAPGGQRVGALCILDRRPRTISDEELALLRDLADWVEKELATDEELVRASEVQRRLLPRRQPELPGYDIAGSCLPARQVGGDFFDWFPVNGEFQFVIADVMGKGVAAALIAASLRAVVRGASMHNDVGEAVNRTANSLEGDLAETDSFATLFCGRFDPTTGRLSYVDAGHGLTGVIRASGRLRRLLSDGLPLGTGFDTHYQAHRIQLDPGDTLVSVSDGFLDYFDTTGAALAAAIRTNEVSGSAQELVDRMCRLGTDSSRSDDLTVIAVRRVPPWT